MRRLKRSLLTGTLAISAVMLAVLAIALLAQDDPGPAWTAADLARGQGEEGGPRRDPWAVLPPPKVAGQEAPAAAGSLSGPQEPAPAAAAAPARDPRDPRAEQREGERRLAELRRDAERAARERRAKETPPGGTLRGLVVGPDGRPAPNAKVELFRKRGVTAVVECDASGRFEAALGAGKWALVASPPAGDESFAPAEVVNAKVAAEQTTELEAPLALRAAGALVGVVVDADEQPVAGARVRVQVPQQRGIEAKARSAAVDEAGRFRVGGLAEGLYRVEVTAAGFVPRTLRDVPLTPARGGEARVVLERGAGLSGLLLGPDGQPVAKGLVFVYRDGRRLASGRAGDDGRYRVEGVLPGPVELFARSQDYSVCARLRAAVQVGRPTVLDLPLGAGPRIAGVLRDGAGKPLAKLTVTARDRDGDVRRQGKSDAQGRYVVKDLYPGSYALSVTHGRSAPLLELSLEVGAGETPRDLVVPAGAAIAGQVVGADQQPVSGANVFAIVGKEYRGTARTDAQGAFRIKDLPADRYQLYVRVGEDRLVGWGELELGPGEARDQLKVVARAPARLRGRVLDASGAPVAGVRLRIRGVSTPVRREATSDAEGRFDVGPFYDGDYRLKADAGGLALLARQRGVDGLALDPFVFQVRLGADVERELALRVLGPQE
ncbi:MAG: carboxypeptidase regulatory-like domain-containing protein [Planctomycetota bacterium]